jgi:hypothetical protein
MRPAPVSTRHLASSEAVGVAPLVPTIVVASYKGGVWKTSLAVAIAERLAWGGLSVVVMVTDSQEDARRRLGVKDPTEPQPKVRRGHGTITVVGARAARATEVLYRTGFSPLKIDQPDVAVVDTAASEAGGSLPGTFLIALSDSTDASVNLVSMLRRSPGTCRVLLARVRRTDPAEWEQDASAVAEASGHRDIHFLPLPIPESEPVKRALDQGRSVWGVPRRGNTLGYLEGIETIVAAAWSWMFPKRELPPGPPAPSGGSFVRGWDDEGADEAR